MAAEDGMPRPGFSTLFTLERKVFGAHEWPTVLSLAELVTALPVPQVDTADPAAGLLATVATDDPATLLAVLHGARLSTVELKLRIARAHIELGDLARAETVLAEVHGEDQWDWRVDWYRGLAAMAASDPAAAYARFNAVYDVVPGEAAPKLAIAAALECQGDYAAAGRYYATVWRTDHSHVSAAFGLARTRLRTADRAGAIETLDSVPESSSHHQVAQLAAIRACTHDRVPAEIVEDELVAAASRLEAVELDAERRALVAVEVLACARDRAAAGVTAASGRTLLGSALTELDLSRGLERCYRELARLAPTRRQRIALVDQANSVRPLTWV